MGLRCSLYEGASKQIFPREVGSVSQEYGRECHRFAYFSGPRRQKLYD